ncbi:MAG: ferredoxin [Verrucomicrobia bacterium]|nr:ferredoxin [Verrucomicrobiota bacterium]
MADKTRILKENVPGKWYVDDSCTPCHVCLEEAPKLLKYNDDQTYVYFFKQPETPEELDAAQRALDICPRPPRPPRLPPLRLTATTPSPRGCAKTPA